MPNKHYSRVFCFLGVKMNKNGLSMFLSHDSIKRHEEYYKELKLRYSIIEKSYPSIIGKSLREISRMAIDLEARERALDLMRDISSHDCYFSSFCKDPRMYKPIKRYFSSEADFVYQIFTVARNSKSNFVYVCKSKRGIPVITEEYSEFPILAIDLCEHAYMFDYGFSREEYLRRALGYLDISKLSLEPLDNAVKKG